MIIYHRIFDKLSETYACCRLDACLLASSRFALVGTIQNVEYLHFIDRY